MAIVRLKSITITAHQALPAVSLRNARKLVIGRLRTLIGHLEEEQIGKLLNIVAVGHAIVSQEVAVVPEALDDCLCCCGHVKYIPSYLFLSCQRSPTTRPALHQQHLLPPIQAP